MDIVVMIKTGVLKVH